MNVLLILNDPPYGTERSYNGLRLALALAKVEGTTVRVFLMADAVACAKPGQTTPEGYYNIGRMLKGLTSKGVEVGTCGSCMDTRGFTDADLAGASVARRWSSLPNGRWPPTRSSRSDERLAHPDQDDKAGGRRQRCDRGDGRWHPERIRDHACHQRADRKAEVPPQAVSADRRAAPDRISMYASRPRPDVATMMPAAGGPRCRCSWTGMTCPE